MCRLSVAVFVCFGLTDLSVYGRVPLKSSNVIFPDSEYIINNGNKNLPSAAETIETIDSDNGFFTNNNSPSSERTTRQVNRRPIPQQSGNTQTFLNTGNQGDVFLGIDPNDNQPPNQSTASNTSGCMDICKARTTQQYNPVCGTDAQTYQNRQNLDCVINCGIQTEFSYTGRCLKVKSA
ncbi:Kazal domain [Cinara cedri]|uniref:Kazal domain n=1 Tax=Cinara cedri TaxID=506608 RepID=A0A5E4N4T3_9HEMI|nr:Kazal domain [Cinara cedri]